MKLKYYLRGLGIGMMVTALILALAPGKSENSAMTDAQIIARAKELGMVERKSLSDTVQPDTQALEDTDAVDEAPPSEGQQTDIHVEESSIEEPSIEESSMEESSMEEPFAEEPSMEEPSDLDDDGQAERFSNAEEETVRIEIARGDSSDTVCRKLKEAGLVVDETAYNRYLCENGYDKSILANTYEIPVGMSEIEIAALITGR